MSRKPPSDTFTRFTSNSIPNASTKPPSSTPSFTPTSTTTISNPPQPSNTTVPPANETPAQRLARLRAAHVAKTTTPQSAADRIIDRGRLYADRVHRFTTYSLLAFAAVSGAFTVYGIISLISHNRRQKRAWIEREMERLHGAQRAFLSGTADAEQLHLLEMERAGEEMVQKKKQEAKERTIWGRIKGILPSGSMGVETMEDKRRDQVAREVREGRLLEVPIEQQRTTKQVQVAVKESTIPGVGLDEKGRPVPLGRMKTVVDDGEVQPSTTRAESVLPVRRAGGPLDILAGNVTVAVAPSSEGGGWLSWLRGSR